MIEPNITRSTGTPIGATGLVAGGGFEGITAGLDVVVQAAAAKLADAYGADVEIRFNSDRESGGAWLVTADGSNAWVGICASLVTARARAAWERSARESELMAETGICTWGRQATSRQRRGARECAAEWRETLARNPEGQLTVYAHIEYAACTPELRDELARLPGWNAMDHRPDQAYHHGAADSVAGALERCLRFAPPARIAGLAAIVTGNA